MIKSIALATVLGFVGFSASAQGYQCTLQGVRVNAQVGQATCQCSQPVAVGAFCPFDNQPGTATHTRGTPSGVQPRQPDHRTEAPSSGTCPYDAGTCRELAERYAREHRAAPVGAPASPPVYQPASTGGSCWTKHEMTKGQLVLLLNMGTASGNWAANMCMTPEAFTRAFERVQDWSNSSTVTAFATSVAGLTEKSCTDTMLKNMVTINSAGQKTGPAGKCQEDDVLWTDGNGVPVFSQKLGKVLVRKDAIIREK